MPLRDQGAQPEGFFDPFKAFIGATIGGVAGPAGRAVGGLFGGTGAGRSIFGRGGGGPQFQFGRGRPQEILGQADAAGLFNPYLPESYFDPLRRELFASGRAREGRAAIDAELDAAGDPLLRAFLTSQARSQSQGDIARSIAAARASAQEQQLQRIWQLLQGFSGSQFGAMATREANR